VRHQQPVQVQALRPLDARHWLQLSELQSVHPQGMTRRPHREREHGRSAMCPASNLNAFPELRWVLRVCQDVALQPKCRSAGVLTLSTAPTLVRSFLLAPGADASPASPSLVSLATSTALRWFGTALLRNCNCAINAAGQDRVQCHWCQSEVKLHTILV